MISADRYPIPSCFHRDEEIIQRSRFITSIRHTPNMKEGKSFISQIKGEFTDASHNCWAYLIGQPGDSSRIGFSDDKEPRGTAGRPMLNVLLHCGIGDLTAVMTRYFGGVKLGKGGLVRAYSGCLKKALEGLPLKENIIQTELCVQIDYKQVSAFKYHLQEFEAKIEKEEYTEAVSYTIILPKENMSQFFSFVKELTHKKNI